MIFNTEIIQYYVEKINLKTDSNDFIFPLLFCLTTRFSINFSCYNSYICRSFFISTCRFTSYVQRPSNISKLFQTVADVSCKLAFYTAILRGSHCKTRGLQIIPLFDSLSWLTSYIHSGSSYTKI